MDAVCRRSSALVSILPLNVSCKHGGCALKMMVYDLVIGFPSFPRWTSPSVF